MKNGLIMESGALNGVLFSNSLMFEQFANWTSINVEADPGQLHHSLVYLPTYSFVYLRKLCKFNCE